MSWFAGQKVAFFLVHIPIPLWDGWVLSERDFVG